MKKVLLAGIAGLILTGCANNFIVRAQYINGMKQESGVNDFRSIELEVRGRGTTPETLLMSFPRVLNQVVGIFMEDKDKPKR